ncbi:hypothetical protein CsSME_00040324 [Camellia sinensis var. sinensis]
MSFRGANAYLAWVSLITARAHIWNCRGKKVYRYVIFKIDEKKKEVVVEKTGELPKSKIFFIAWSPAVSRIRAKMLYATSKDRFRRELEGIHYEIQATDPTEMDLEVIQDRAH